MKRPLIPLSQNQPAWVRSIFWIFLDDLPRIQHVSDVIHADPPLEHALDRVNPENQFSRSRFHHLMELYLN